MTVRDIFADGEKVRLTLYNSRHEKVEGTEAEGSFASNKAEDLLPGSGPAGSLPGTREANGRRLLSDPYEITPDTLVFLIYAATSKFEMRL